MRWHHFLQDYGVQFHYIKGSTNPLADILSRLPFAEGQNMSDDTIFSDTLHETGAMTLRSNTNMHLIKNMNDNYSFPSDDNLISDADLLGCFVH